MIYDIIQELKNESGKNAKIAILQREKNNELLKEVLVAALSPHVQYYQRKIPAYEPCVDVSENLGLPTPLSEALDSLEALSSRKVTGHEAIEFLAAVLGDLSPDDADVFERVVKKNLDCGVQASTVNKVWPKLIPTYPCLLAKGFDEKAIGNMVWPAYSQLKADGMRANAFLELTPNGREVTGIRGRSGKHIDLLGELDEDLIVLEEHIRLQGLQHSHMNLTSGFVLDGELIAEDSDGNIVSRSKSNGMLNKGIKGTISQAEAATVRMRVWDIIPIDDFLACKCARPYSERFDILRRAVEAAGDSILKVQLIETKVVKDLGEAQHHFEELLLKGEEGTIIKNPKHIWEDKRSKGLVKMKAEEEADLEVVAWEEGTGKYKGMMGALVGRSSDGKVEVSVGSGFSDAQRKWLESDVVGRIMTVKYNVRIQSEDRPDIDSLFLPRFVEIREDKDEANSSKEIV